MEASDIKKIKDLEYENRRLKHMFADQILECRALEDVIEKSFKTCDKAWIRQLRDRTVFDEYTPGMQDFIAEQDCISLPAGCATEWAGDVRQTLTDLQRGGRFWPRSTGDRNRPEYPGPTDREGTGQDSGKPWIFVEDADG